VDPVTLVSVILPTYNRPGFVAAAIDSVIKQSCPDWELIIADDGSADETADHLRALHDHRITVLRLPHSGNPSKVRNAAIRRARGEYLALLDSDDLWAPTKIETQLATMRSSPGCRWSYTATADIDATGRLVEIAGRAPWTPLSGNIVDALITIRAIVSTSSVMAERSLVEEVGGFDEQQLFGEDYDLFIRLAQRSPVAVVDRRLMFERNQEDSYSADRIGAYEGWVRLYDNLTRSLSDDRLRVLAAHRRAETILILARLYADAGRRTAAYQALARAARGGPRSPEWWWRALKTLVRATLLTPMRSL
jgi:glycosyltransferase involved in cell wall biosynthesis